MKREHGLALALLVAGAVAAHAGERPVPSYTDDDLARIRPLRGETGVLSVPPAHQEPPPGARVDAHGESYWRGEAAKLAEKLRPLRHEADTLRSRIAAASARATQPPARSVARRGTRQSHGSGATPPRVVLEPPAPDTRALEDRLRSVEAEIRERESELEERARRERALPGWIR